MRRLLGLLGIALLISACGSEPAQLAGYVRDPLPFVGEASMPDVSRNNAPFLFQAEPDGVLVVNFGFTSCPDVYPTTLAEIRAALRDLGPLAEQVSVAMVTVDPDRDVPAVVTGYLQSFVADGHALRGDDSQLAAAAGAFDVLYEVTVSDDGSVDVGHTASVFVVDDRGFLRVTWPFGMPADDMASDLRILLATD